jgi:hypothetical protein
MLALIQSYMWIWGGTFPGAIFVVAFGVLALGVHAAHRRGDSLAELGIRLDTFLPAAREAAAVTLPIVMVILIAGAFFDRIRPDWRVVIGRLLWLVGWGFLQQFMLQGFVNRNLAAVVARDRDRDLLVGAVFAFCHLPNPRLTIATFVAGWIWAILFRRRPNLFAIALSHAVGSAALSIAFGPELMGGMRVGRGYLNLR